MGKKEFLKSPGFFIQKKNFLLLLKPIYAQNCKRDSATTRRISISMMMFLAPLPMNFFVISDSIFFKDDLLFKPKNSI